MKTRDWSPRICRVLWITLIISLIGATMPGPLSAREGRDGEPTDSDRQYYAETGFWIVGEFKKYFDTHGGLEIFGYPISSPYNAGGVLVQYFQNARMEWHAAGPDSGQIRLGNLGEELGFQTDPIDPPPLATRRVYFDETGHSVAPPFLRHYRDRGGPEFFGYPVTEMYFENQKIVQYFQKLKLIWDPQTGEMTVGNLGDLYIKVYRSSLLPSVLAPQASNLDPNIRMKRDLRPIVGLGQTVVSSRQEQELAVVVLDSATGEAIPDARVYVTLKTENGKPFFGLSVEAITDEQGRIRAPLPMNSVEPGTRVVVDVTATDGVSTAETQQLFLVWW